MVEPVGPPEDGIGAGPMWKRLAWFVGIAAASVTVVATLAYALRAFLFL